jgi:SH3 domain-containing protein
MSKTRDIKFPSSMLWGGDLGVGFFRALILFFLILTLPIQAQDTTWQIWVYDANLGQTVLVDNRGTVQSDTILPVPAPYITWEFSRTIAVSPDGTRLAYSVVGTNTENERLSTFIVYETSSERLLFSYNVPLLPITNSFDFSRIAFSSTGNALSFAYATGDSIEDASWRILIFNSIDGRIITELTSDSSVMAAQNILLAPYLLPVIQYFGEATVSFNLIPYQTLGFDQDLFSFEWNIVTGRVSRSNRAPRITGDTWSITGETIVPAVDNRINYDTEYTPYTNAVHVYRPDIMARIPLYATTTYDIFRVNFVQNGERVLVTAQDLIAFEMSRLLVERSGVSRVLPNIVAVNDILIGTPDGFAYVIDNPQTPFLILVNTRDDTFPQFAIWQAPAETEFFPVWASVLGGADYAAWAQLAAPIFIEESIILPDRSDTGVEPQSVASPTPLGSSNSIITVDSVAMISTTGGDRLNMRDSPNLSGNVIARVESGARIVIIAGPVAADGFIWWEIRLSTGQTGWVVERAEGVRTLIPAG